ncbi:MAG: DUF2835 family protein [Candidatus Endonucleobacter bathymodioli]|uniref:DUF2835 family protein n=1 Tax=Candidatus Endonucleibacter bathymodioli TaxID=539814 RepID=A0AA90NM96_9GAMM|nr:DUF2835 family protein [Candidatus Endonucleobacter bathymodioli]
MPKAVFSISLSSDQVLQFYKGLKHRVQVRTTEGQSMSLPYNILVQHVTREGIYGTFEITYGDDGTLGELQRIS